jgi:hypothetical protein
VIFLLLQHRQPLPFRFCSLGLCVIVGVLPRLGRLSLLQFS